MQHTYLVCIAEIVYYCTTDCQLRTKNIFMNHVYLYTVKFANTVYMYKKAYMLCMYIYVRTYRFYSW